MDINNLLISKFKNISKVFLEVENNYLFLRVKTNLNDLQMITKLSKKISVFLDEINYSNKEYYLDVYSLGTEKIIEKKELNKYLNKNLFVEFKVAVKGLEFLEGQLIDVSDSEIVIKWNATGQFRNQVIEFENIKLIRRSATLQKGK